LNAQSCPNWHRTTIKIITGITVPIDINRYQHTEAIYRVRTTNHPIASPSEHPNSQSHNRTEPLSDRELEVLRLIAGGHSNQAIADMLIIAISTVKRHINNIYGKLAVQSRTQALMRARELQLL
jgi:ATP/maltotriose-dependent transcriptional regulator MalT